MLTEHVLLDVTPADIQRVTGETDHVERVNDGDCVGDRVGSEPLLEYGLRAALVQVQQPR